MYIPDIIATNSSNTSSDTAKHAAPFLFPAATTGRISPLKCLHFCFVYGVAMEAEVPAI